MPWHLEDTLAIWGCFDRIEQLYSKTYLVTNWSTSASLLLAKEVRISRHPVGTNTRLSARALAHTLGNPLVRLRLFTLPLSATGDMARKARTLVNPSQPASPGLILLTFAVTRHLAARRCSTHSLTDGGPPGGNEPGRSLQLIAQDAGFSATGCQRSGEIWVALATHYGHFKSGVYAAAIWGGITAPRLAAAREPVF